MPLPDPQVHRELRQQLFAELARVNRALAAPARIELLELLSQAERSVEVLADLAGLSVANTSQHLRVLRRSGLVLSRRDGQFVRYRLSGPESARLLDTLHTIALRSSPALGRLVDAYRRSTDTQPPVSADELQALTAAGSVTLIDVRPVEEFEAGHLRQAISLPLARIEAAARDLPADREVIAYCRGVLCLLSLEAVARLRAAGLQARRLEFGLSEWRLAGLPIVTP
ncbi:MAG: metalloregulator ArsR/SmtB family transcription factor [Burkholderiales bacterium]|nr:metalloregulator ArsR/SmtB family transcription factor [Burkholderiales bacterium]